MSNYKAIIVEDDRQTAKKLAARIKKHFPEIETATCSNLTNAKLQIENTEPDLVFLDLNLGSGDGFDLLRVLKYKSFKLILTTASKNKILEAMHEGAVDYLHKPYSDEKFIRSVERALNRINSEKKDYIEKINNGIISSIKNFNLQSRIIEVVNKEGTHPLRLSEIIFCATTWETTRYGNVASRIVFRLLDRPSIITSTRTIESCEIEFSPYQFSKVSQSYVVNLNHIRTYKRTSCDLVMKPYRTENGLTEQEEIQVTDRKGFERVYNQFINNQ